MILRKPYAFLIKHFKLLHAIITVFMVYVLYKTINILSFYGEYASINAGLVDIDEVNSLYPFLIFFAPIMIIIVSLILLVVMIIKKKPYIMYIINIVVYLACLILFFVGNSVLTELSKNLVDIRVIKLVKDLTTFGMLFQTYPLMKNFVRAVGFDIKQFDFGADLAQIEIEEKDNEEFEVELSVDTNKVKRNVNSGKRNIRYFYAENKFIINLIAGIAIVIMILISIWGFWNYNNKTSINQTFSMDNLQIKVLNAYSTNLNYKGKNINGLREDHSLVIVPLTVINNRSSKTDFVTAKIELKIGNHKYRHKDIYRDSLLDFTRVFEGGMIDAKTTLDTSLVFEVPTKYINNKMHVKFITSIESKKKRIIPYYVDIKVKPKNIDISLDSINLNMGEEIDLDNIVLGNSKIKINSIEINNRFKIEYNYCLTSKECIKSYEYLMANLDSNIDKSLLKIDGDLILDENYKAKSINYLYDLITYYGTIRYEVDGSIKSISSNMTKVNPTATKSNKIIYISVPKEIESATSVDLIFKIRNKEYIYKLK